MFYFPLGSSKLDINSWRYDQLKSTKRAVKHMAARKTRNLTIGGTNLCRRRGSRFIPTMGICRRWSIPRNLGEKVTAGGELVHMCFPFANAPCNTLTKYFENLLFDFRFEFVSDSKSDKFSPTRPPMTFSENAIKN